MSSKKFDKLFDFIGQKKFTFLIILCFVLILSLIRISQTSFVNDVAIMLPDSPEINRFFDFINNSDMADTIVFSITLKDTSNKNLLSLTADFSDKLKTVSGITDVVTGVENFDIAKVRLDLAKLLPLLVSKSDYNLFKDIEKSEYIKNRVKLMFIMLTTPGSSFLQDSVNTDPFGWSDHMLKKLETLGKTMGFDVELHNNHFVDKTHKHALVIAKTSVPVTDADGSEYLLFAINNIIKLSRDIDIETVCGHKHTLSNQKIIKKDIYVTTFIVTLAFTVLMLFMFKAFDALSIFILPLPAIIISVFISTFVFKSLSLFIIGFAAVIAGISVDYGIHLFTAWKTEGYKRFINTVKPVIIASSSTLGVFVSFLISSVYGYKELAVFSIISIIICVILSILFLPHFWTDKGSLKNTKIYSELSLSESKFVLVIWGLVFIFSMICFINSNFTKASDISTFDGSDQSIFDTEDRFYNIWGGKKRPGVIVTEGKDIETAWHEYESISGRLSSKTDGFNSLAVLLPSLEQQRQNLHDWQEFWTDDKISRTETAFLKELEPYGFREKSFDDFFTLLKSKNLKIKQQVPDILKLFKQHFIKKHGQSYNLLSFFDDTKENIENIESVLEKYPDSYIVSRRKISSLIGKQLITDMKKISLFAFCWIFVIIVFFLEKSRMVFLALLPVITSISFVFLVLNLISMEVTAIVLIALIIILGISLDYGVFISGAGSDEERNSVILAASFSMLTTVMGAGALLFASHPVMFSIGVTLVSGVVAAYLSAVFCIPAFQKVLKK
ncbi:MAG: hypothetical protein GY749_14365 [Desulfobacteraceae bacterium]|nr:hypothetical protein [Desulfobacteraceae bacterium]